MAELRLHLDADISIRALHQALLERGYDVSRTPTDWIPLDASDEMQLLGALAQGRCLVSFNIRDFVILAQKHLQHRGIILANQQDWRLAGLIAALDRVFKETASEEWLGQVRWLNDWRV